MFDQNEPTLQGEILRPGLGNLPLPSEGSVRFSWWFYTENCQVSLWVKWENLLLKTRELT